MRWRQSREQMVGFKLEFPIGSSFDKFNILITGGWRIFHDSKDVFMVGPRDGKFELRAHMHYYRARHSMAILEGKAYSIGGDSDLEKQMDKVEVYDQNTDTWTMVAPLFKRRESHAAITFKDQIIYVFGGYEEATIFPTDTIECYETSQRTWNIIDVKLPVSKLSKPMTHSFLSFSSH